MRDQWDPIFAGNGDIARVAAQHAADYKECMPSMPEFAVREITKEQVLRVCRAAPATAPGPDGWAPTEFRVLPGVAAELLAGMFNEVEKGKPWPEQTRLAKCANVCKVGEVSCRPQDYRGLL
eukprot:13740948-Alexandrium_andersonii.AAC.1